MIFCYWLSSHSHASFWWLTFNRRMIFWVIRWLVRLLTPAILFVMIGEERWVMCCCCLAAGKTVVIYNYFCKSLAINFNPNTYCTLYAVYPNKDEAFTYTGLRRFCGEKKFTSFSRWVGNRESIRGMCGMSGIYWFLLDVKRYSFDTCTYNN